MAPLVLALNPAVDVEWRVDQFEWEEKNVIQAEHRWAGGKSINVARWLKHLGAKPRMLIPLGGEPGDELADYLRRERLSADVLALRESSRVNVVVTSAEGRQIRFNQAGPKLSPQEWKIVMQKTRRLLPKTSCLVLSGSPPRGIPADAYGQLIRLARRAGVKSVLDCDGEALRSAVASRPFLIKPNEYALGLWANCAGRSTAALLRAARALSKASDGWVLVSRGGKGGLLVNASLGETFMARPPQIKTLTTVGTGDALVAGVVRQIESGAPAREWLRWGVATGAAATQCPGGKLPARGLIEKYFERTVMR